MDSHLYPQRNTNLYSNPHSYPYVYTYADRNTGTAATDRYTSHSARSSAESGPVCLRSLSRA